MIDEPTGGPLPTLGNPHETALVVVLLAAALLGAVIGLLERIAHVSIIAALYCGTVIIGTLLFGAFCWLTPRDETQ